MILNGTGNHNGHIEQGQLFCPSDYEPRPLFDITPKPAQRVEPANAKLTFNMQWAGDDGVQYSATVRGDTTAEVFDTVRTIQTIRKASVARAEKSKAAAPVVLAADDTPDTLPCLIHGVAMARRISKRTGGSYFSHQLPDNTLCYGREKTQPTPHGTRPLGW